MGQLFGDTTKTRTHHFALVVAVLALGNVLGVHAPEAAREQQQQQHTRQHVQIHLSEEAAAAHMSACAVHLSEDAAAADLLACANTPERGSSSSGHIDICSTPAEEVQCMRRTDVRHA